jgi:hypothetical protein
MRNEWAEMRDEERGMSEKYGEVYSTKEEKYCREEGTVI